MATGKAAVNAAGTETAAAAATAVPAASCLSTLDAYGSWLLLRLPQLERLSVDTTGATWAVTWHHLQQHGSGSSGRCPEDNVMTTSSQASDLDTLVAAAAAAGAGRLRSLVLLPGMGPAEVAAASLLPLTAAAGGPGKNLRQLRLVGCFTSAAGAGGAASAARAAAGWRVLRQLDGLHELCIHQLGPHPLQLPVSCLPASLDVLQGRRLHLSSSSSSSSRLESHAAAAFAAPELRALRLQHCQLDDASSLASSDLQQLTVAASSWPGSWQAAAAAWPGLKELTAWCPDTQRMQATTSSSSNIGGKRMDQQQLHQHQRQQQRQQRRQGRLLLGRPAMRQAVGVKWLLLTAGNMAAAASMPATVQKLACISDMPLQCAETLVSAGVIPTYPQLVAAARSGAQGLQEAYEAAQQAGQQQQHQRLLAEQLSPAALADLLLVALSAAPAAPDDEPGGVICNLAEALHGWNTSSSAAPEQRAAVLQWRQQLQAVSEQLQPAVVQQLLELALFRGHVALVQNVFPSLVWQAAADLVMAAVQHHIKARQPRLVYAVAASYAANQLSTEQMTELLYVAVKHRGMAVKQQQTRTAAVLLKFMARQELEQHQAQEQALQCNNTAAAQLICREVHAARSLATAGNAGQLLQQAAADGLLGSGSLLSGASGRWFNGLRDQLRQLPRPVIEQALQDALEELGYGSPEFTALLEFFGDTVHYLSSRDYGKGRAQVRQWEAEAVVRLVAAAVQLQDAEAACGLCDRSAQQWMHEGLVEKLLRVVLAQQRWQQQQPDEQQEQLHLKVLHAVLSLRGTAELRKSRAVVRELLQLAVQQAVPRQVLELLICELNAGWCLQAVAAGTMQARVSQAIAPSRLDGGQ
ncbi:hypothetical protein COO60DRAFT_1639353 [Scenedesmus sp. NREL 46B-D3]|nr:hypothetical protein COO60DRAFT_1639353 [Scenedesmus sp. NREL 46B-D3]